MKTLAGELPFAQAVLSENLSIACSNCFAIKEDKKKDPTGYMDYELPKLQKCGKCRHIYYCSKKCQRDDWKHHKDECEFLVKSHSCPSHVIRILSRMIMRVKRGNTPVAFNGRTFDDLTDPLDQILADPLATPDRLPYGELVKFMGSENVPPEKDVLSFYGKYCVNHFPVFRDSFLMTDVGHALYLGLSAHKHSCRPDCVTVFLGTKAVLKAIDPTTKKYNKDLTVSFPDVMRPKKFRHLSGVRECECKRCTDEEEKLLERSGKCGNCQDGYVLPVENGPLRCAKCNKESPLTFQMIEGANMVLESFQKFVFSVEAVKARVRNVTDVMKFVKIYTDMKRVLSPYNLYLFALADFVEKAAYVGLGSEQSHSVVKESLYARGKAIEKYCPFSREHRQYVLDLANLEKYIGVKIDRSSKQHESSTDAFQKAYDVIQKCYGPEHPLAEKLAKEYADAMESVFELGMYEAAGIRPGMAGLRI